MKNKISNLTKKSVKRIINENYDAMNKEVDTPYPNFRIKVLSLSDVPAFEIKNNPHWPHNATYFSNDKLYVQREGNKREKIRIDCIRTLPVRPYESWAWYLKFKEGSKSYDYFNRLLMEVKF